MIRHTVFGAALIAATVVAAPVALADVVIEEAWVRATPGTLKVTAGYARLRNTGTRAETLVRVTTPAAGATELHRTVHKGGMMEMDAVPELVIPAGSTVAFTPGDYHLMIMQVSQPLQVGEAVDITFTFRDQKPVTARAKVLPISANRYQQGP